MENEIALGERILVETDRFVVFHPFASKSPLETWIAPKHHQPSFGKASENDFPEMAHVLKLTLESLHNALGDHDPSDRLSVARLLEEINKIRERH